MILGLKFSLHNAAGKEKEMLVKSIEGCEERGEVWKEVRVLWELIWAFMSRSDSCCCISLREIKIAKKLSDWIQQKQTVWNIRQRSSDQGLENVIPQYIFYSEGKKKASLLVLPCKWPSNLSLKNHWLNTGSTLLCYSSANFTRSNRAMMKLYKMIKDSRVKEDQIKQEEGGAIDYTQHQMSKRLCSSLPNQRIARLSQSDHFGGKDRHSKVSTIKGLRDRRVRLSIPTAIQVYDLQDKLGLNQPSKVVDWLINAAQNEIDKLLPEPLLPSGNSFIQFPQTDLNSNNIRAQAFSINTDPFMLISNNYVDDITSFPKPTLNSYHSYYQMEPYASHVGNNHSSQEVFSNDFHLASASSSLSSSLTSMPAETQLVMPSSFSSYLTGANSIQTPSTFAELLPWNSSSINFKQYVQQDEAARQLGNSSVYKDSGAGYGCSAADFF